MPAKRLDLTGQKFWKLTVIWLAFYKDCRSYWNCECECWNKKVVSLWNLRLWQKWCWCLHYVFKIQRWKENNMYKHWMTKTKFYKKYISILERCNNKNCKAYKNYGWRWIQCKWKSFEEFKNDMYWSYEKWLTIDRIDNNWNYNKINCRRATIKEQQLNKRNNNYIEYDWKYLHISEWSNITWIKRRTLHKRIYKLKWTIEKSLTLI